MFVYHLLNVGMQMSDVFVQELLQDEIELSRRTGDGDEIAFFHRPRVPTFGRVGSQSGAHQGLADRKLHLNIFDFLFV